MSGKTAAKVIKFIKENCALDDEVTSESRFSELSIDSLSFITAIVEIETYFGIDFDDGFIMSEYETIENLHGIKKNFFFPFSFSFSLPKCYKED